MADTVPSSIAAPFQSVPAEGADNERQKAALREKLDNRTVSVYDDRDNSILQAPIADEQKYRDMGLVVGDAEVAKKQVQNSPLAQVDAYVHGAANSASFNTYDNIAALLGKKDYLKNEAEVANENPKSTLGGNLTGGLISAEGRGFDKVGMALSAYEGGTAAATNDYALDEPITAERVLKGSGTAMLYNALFNKTLDVAAKGFKYSGRGLTALNSRLGVFLREGEAAGETSARPIYRPTPRGGLKAPIESPIEPVVKDASVPEAPINEAQKPTPTAAEKMGASIKRDREEAVKEWHANEVEQKKALIELDGMDHESSAADKIRKSLAKMEEKAKALDAELHPAYGDEGFEPAAGQEHAYDRVIDSASNDEAALRKLHGEINEHQLNAKRAHNENVASKPDGFDFKNDPKSQSILQELLDYTRLRGKTRISMERLKRGGKFVDAEFEVGGPSSGEHIFPKDAPTEEGAFEYPKGTSKKQQIHMWRNSYRDLLDTEHANLLDAARQHAGARGDAFNKSGDLVEASKAFEEKATIERQLHQMYPDTLHPETGELKPGFKKHIAEYSRLQGNDTSGLGTLKYRMATSAEKSAIDAEVAAHPDSAAQFVGDEASQKPHIGEGEPHVPEKSQKIKDLEANVRDSKQRIEDTKAERTRGGEHLSRSEIERLNKEFDLHHGAHEYDKRALERELSAEKAPGEVNKVSDITGKTPAEQSGAAVGKGGPRYVPRYRRSSFWKLNLATLGMAKTLIGSAAALNEIGPFVLNNQSRFAEGVQALADSSAKGTAGAIRKAISGTVGRNAAIGDVKKEFDNNVKIVTAGQANPGSLEQGVTALLGPAAQAHPELVGHTVAALGRQLNVMSNGMPRNVQTPTARGSDYTPPRSVMIRYNRRVRAISDPDEAIAHPDPDTWAAVKEAHPETAKYVEETLMAVVANPKIKLNKQQARNVSVLLGQAITPQNQPEYLKSLHDAATLMNAPNPPGKQGSGGSTSAKTGQQMLSLDATPEQQNQLNL